MGLRPEIIKIGYKMKEKLITILLASIIGALVIFILNHVFIFRDLNLKKPTNKNTWAFTSETGNMYIFRENSDGSYDLQIVPNHDYVSITYTLDKDKSGYAPRYDDDVHAVTNVTAPNIEDLKCRENN